MSFEYKGAKIRAQELTIADDDQITTLMARAGDDPATATTRYRYAEYMIAAKVDKGESPVPLVALTDTDDAIRASYEQWRLMPRAFGRLWNTELNKVEGLPNA